MLVVQKVTQMWKNEPWLQGMFLIGFCLVFTLKQETVPMFHNSEILHKVKLCELAFCSLGEADQNNWFLH